MFLLNDHLRVICSLLIGDKGTFTKYFRLFRLNWFETLPAYILYFHPGAKIDKLGEYTEVAVIDIKLKM
jgi:hypothetical protein